MSTSGSSLPQYDVVSRTRATGPTPRNGGAQNPKATPSSDPHPTKATASFQSSPTLRQNPVNSTGHQRRDGYRKGTKRYMDAMNRTTDSECSDINGALFASTMTLAKAPSRFWLRIGNRNLAFSPLCSSRIAWLFHVSKPFWPLMIWFGFLSQFNTQFNFCLTFGYNCIKFDLGFSLT